MNNEKRDNVKFIMQIVVLPILGLLMASEGWQYYKAPDKIKEDTEKHSKVEFDENIDSLRAIIKNEEFVKGVFSEGVGLYKDLGTKDSEEYLIDILKLADKGLQNDSMWTNVQLPFIIWMLENREKLEWLFTYEPIVPIRHRETGELYYNWFDKIRPTYSREVNGGTILGVRDGNDDNHVIQELSSIKDR